MAVAGGRLERRLTSPEFQQPDVVSAALKWFATIDNHAPAARTIMTWKMSAVLSASPASGNSALSLMRIHWPGAPSWKLGGLAGAAIRRKLAALTSVLDRLLQKTAVGGGPRARRQTTSD
jgi:hypothetical protein